ncbi:hypothetical protein R1sor_022740 [Riccia sorocarpa]|uniref:FCP1 homology domain-containing protein n=1 Tax=Riccia sorocarpa TaxID=122646 RepID=A0ABD3GMW7_9MARC
MYKELLHLPEPTTEELPPPPSQSPPPPQSTPPFWLTGTNGELQVSVHDFKPTLVHPTDSRQKTLILDVDGILCRVRDRKAHYLEAGIRGWPIVGAGNIWICPRSGLSIFMNQVIQDFHLIIWTHRTEDVTQFILKTLQDEGFLPTEMRRDPIKDSASVRRRGPLSDPSSARRRGPLSDLSSARRRDPLSDPSSARRRSLMMDSASVGKRGPFIGPRFRTEAESIKETPPPRGGGVCSVWNQVHCEKAQLGEALAGSTTEIWMKDFRHLYNWNVCTRDVLLVDEFISANALNHPYSAVHPEVFQPSFLEPENDTFLVHNLLPFLHAWNASPDPTPAYVQSHYKTLTARDPIEGINFLLKEKALKLIPCLWRNVTVLEQKSLAEELVQEANRSRTSTARATSPSQNVSSNPSSPPDPPSPTIGTATTTSAGRGSQSAGRGSTARGRGANFIRRASSVGRGRGQPQLVEHLLSEAEVMHQHPLLLEVEGR